MKYYFNNQLQEGTILNRPNRFIFKVEINGVVVEAHCPSGGIIGGLKRKDFIDIPCLLTFHGENTERKTKYTVEAISLDDKKTWFGINQIRSNFYVENFLKAPKVQELLRISNNIAREKKLKNSRIDFKIGNTYLEVKTMVSEYYNKASEEFEKLMGPTEPSVERMQKHIKTLSESIDSGNRAIILSVFQYEAPKFIPPTNNPKYRELVEEIKIARKKGLENWQMTLKFTPDYIELITLERNEYELK